MTDNSIAKTAIKWDGPGYYGVLSKDSNDVFNFEKLSPDTAAVRIANGHASVMYIASYDYKTGKATIAKQN